MHARRWMKARHFSEVERHPMQGISSAGVSTAFILEAVEHTSRLFSPEAAETILCENMYKHRYEISAILAAADADATVCDLGAGPGVNLLTLRRLGHRGRLVLIDRFDEYVAGNRMGAWQQIIAVLENHDIEIVRKDFWADALLPLSDDSVAVATCFDVVEHLPGHPLRQLRELHRLLRPGGRCIISGPNGVSLMKRLKTLAGRYPYAPFEAWVSDSFYEHYREYEPAEYAELLRRVGFEHVAYHASADVTVCRAARGFHRRRLSALSPKRAALWGAAAVEVAFPSLRHTIYASGVKAPRELQD